LDLIIFNFFTKLVRLRLGLPSFFAFDMIN
jgi:hypothetical protein